MAIARPALAIDGRRRPYQKYRFAPNSLAVAQGRHREMWFAGVHSDVGAQFPDDHRLADIAFAWMVGEAAETGLRVDPKAYRRLLTVDLDESLPEDHALGALHPAGAMWRLVGSRQPADPGVTTGRLAEQTRRPSPSRG